MTEPEREPCPTCGKEVTWTAAGAPRKHKCEPKDPPCLWMWHPESESIFIITEQEYFASQNSSDMALCAELGRAIEKTPEELRIILRLNDWQEEETDFAVRNYMESQEKKPAKVTADAVIAAFIKTRDEIDLMRKELDAKIADLKALQDKRSQWLKERMKDLGVTSLKSEHGTCFIDNKDSATVDDRELFFSWVKDNDRYEFLESRVSKTAVKQLLEDGETLPPGVNYTKIEDVKVRRK